MSVLRTQSTVSRLALVAMFAVMLATGTFTAMKPSPAAAPPVTCARMKGIAFGYAAIANVMDVVGMYGEASYYWDMGGVYYDYC
ncbi:MAG: hypothetical protein ACJ789_01380 [Thermomicrobiales bacterium]